MARYIVGDIHACLEELKALLKQVNFSAQHDELWAVGDLIGRGPKPEATLEFLADLGPAFKCTLGNHDLHALAVLCEVRESHPKHNLDPLLHSSERDHWIDWLRHHSLMLVDLERHHVVSHAGIYPEWGIHEALTYAQEIEDKLSGAHFVDLLTDMYGSEPSTWSDTLTGTERARFIINAFSRMRYLTSAGALDFSEKKHPYTIQNKTLSPWYIRWPKTEWTLFFGHWAALMTQTERPDVIGLDSGCVWGKSLTMIHADSGERFTQPATTT